MGRFRTFFVLVALSGCGDKSEAELVDGRFTAEQWAIITDFAPLGELPANPTNRYADNELVAEFGHWLFFDYRYAGPLTVEGLGQIGERGKVACITCHDPNHYFNDSRPDNKLSLGAAVTGRNAPSLVNVSFYEWGNWAGAHDQMWKQGANAVESRDNFNGNRLEYAHIVYEHYRDRYNALFPIPMDPALDPTAPDAARFPASGKPKAAGAPDGAWEMMTAEDRFIINTIMANCGKAYEAYERKLVSGNSPFDQYVAGNYDALTEAAKRGLALFIGKAACDSCHTGSTFSDQDFHNTGVMQTRAPDMLDEGRFTDLPRALNNTFNGAGAFSDDPEAGAAKLAGLTPVDDLKGLFRTKSLRHLTETAPYFHDGSMATLEDVVRFYNEGGATMGFPGTKDPFMVPLNLSSDEVGDLVAFLESLTGDPVPDKWRNPPQ